MSTTPPSLDKSRREILKGLAAISASALFPGCNKSEMIVTSPIRFEAAGNSQPMPAGPLTHGLLNVSNTETGAIGSGFAGLSYEKSALCEPLFTAQNIDLVNLFKLIGPGVLRIGGNSVDDCIWMGNGLGRMAGEIAPRDVDALAGFLKSAGWQCIYGVNLGGFAEGRTTFELARAEVFYVAQKLGASLTGIEIGNECDGYGSPSSYFANGWSLDQFESLWGQFRGAILGAAPGVSITGPASGSNVGDWTVPFAQTVTRKNLSLLTQHYYRGDGHSATATAANLIATDPNLTKCLEMLEAASHSTGIPFRIGECNSYFNGGATGISNSYASALWVLDFIFTCAQGGAVGVNLHGGGHASGYTPIADKAGVVVEARPEFYGLTLFSLAGQGAICETTISAGGLNATAYAVKRSTGELNVIIVNKDTTQNLQLAIALPQSAQSASLITMNQASSPDQTASLTALSGITIQGAGISPNGSFTPGPPYSLPVQGSRIDCFVSALSAVLVQIK
jgi:hypothetical protein